jgi:nitroreductase
MESKYKYFCIIKNNININKMDKIEAKHWQEFKTINANRRAVRDFDGTTIPDEDIRAILSEGTLAPSSGNISPYQLHWIKDQKLKEQVAKACNGQRAASSASTLIVVVASSGIAKKTISDYSNYIETTTLLSEESKAYNRKAVIGTLQKFFKVAPIVFFTPLVNVFSLLLPALSLLQFGGIGVRQWVARNSAFAAQNILLATVAKGYDACPMEGFNAVKIASLLKLPYGSVIPLVIAIGKRSDKALIEPQWRRPLESVIVKH